MDVAKEVSKSLSERVVIAKVPLPPPSLLFFEALTTARQVDGVLWDLERPLERSCKLDLLDFEHPEGACWGLVTGTCMTWPGRETRLLAFVGACVGRGCGEALWVPFVHRTADGRWVLL